MYAITKNIILKLFKRRKLFVMVSNELKLNLLLQVMQIAIFTINTLVSLYMRTLKF